jgi:hypothetical protein
MTVLSITVNDPVPAFSSKAAEVRYLIGVLQTFENEFGRGVGTVTSGTIVGQNAAGTPHTSLGSWSYTPAATKP